MKKTTLGLTIALAAVVMGLGYYEHTQTQMEKKVQYAFESGNQYLLHDKKYQAMGDFSYIIENFDTTYNSKIKNLVAQSLLKKADLQIQIGDLQGAVLSLEHLNNQFIDSNDLQMQYYVCQSLLKEGQLLAQQGQFEPAMIVLSHLVSKFGKDKRPSIRRFVAEAMYNETLVLNHIGKEDISLNVASSIISTFMQDKDQDIRLITAKAIMQRLSNRLKNKEWSLALYNSTIFIQLFANDPSPTIKRFFMLNLLHRAEILHRVKKIPPEDQKLFGTNPQQHALDTYDQLLSMLHPSTDNEDSIYEATAWLGKAQILFTKKNYTEALKYYEDIIHRFSDSTNDKLQLIVAKALLGKAQLLRDTQKIQQALDTYTSILTHYPYKNKQNELMNVVLTAYFEKAQILQHEGQDQAALTLLNDALEQSKEEKEEHLFSKISAIYLEYAALQIKLNQNEQALNTYTSLIALAHHYHNVETRYDGALAILKKAALLISMGKPVEAGQTYDLLLKFYGDDQEENIKELVAQGLYNHAHMLFNDNQGFVAMDLIKEIEKRFQNEKHNPKIQTLVAKTENLKKKLNQIIVW